MVSYCISPNFEGLKSARRSCKRPQLLHNVKTWLTIMLHSLKNRLKGKKVPDHSSSGRTAGLSLTEVAVPLEGRWYPDGIYTILQVLWIQVGAALVLPVPCCKGLAQNDSMQEYLTRENPSSTHGWTRTRSSRTQHNIKSTVNSGCRKPKDRSWIKFEFILSSVFPSTSWNCFFQARHREYKYWA